MEKPHVPAPADEPDRGSVVREPAPGEPEHKHTIVTMKRVKLVYAFALLLALCGAVAAKVATENALGRLRVPIESDYVTVAPATAAAPTTSRDTAQLTHAPTAVHEVVTGVPDTRTETTETTAGETTNAYAVPYQSSYTLPLGTEILREYSPDAPKYSATLGDWRTHAAIDFTGEAGAAVHAISRGTVTAVDDDPLYGTVVTVDHGNGVVARYAGLNADTLKIGADRAVEEGDLLGYLGTVPAERAELPHLHFEVTVNGETADPLEVMGKA